MGSLPVAGSFHIYTRAEDQMKLENFTEKR